MQVTKEQAAFATRIAKEAAIKLAEANTQKVVIADYIPVKKRFLFSKKAHFKTVTEGWALGVLLLDSEGNLYEAGESTRATAPGYPGHTSHERERRRTYTKAAYESGYPQGQVIFFKSPKISLTAGSTLTPESPVLIEESTIKVRWNKGVSHAPTITLEDYLNEQVSLRT